MSTTRVSSKYQIVIPKDVRESIAVLPGQTLQVIAKGGVISLVPVRPLTEMRGFAKGLPTKGFREKEDQF
jgi:AbrB family looped-hinge helix DNA binding protein